MLRVLLILPALLLMLSTASAPPRVVDGDTLHVDGTKYRLCGVNAPERAEPGGAEATAWLRRFIAGKPLRCVIVGHGTPCDGRSSSTSYNRVVGQCFAGSEDIAAALVRAGHAQDMPKFSGGFYRP